jgi:hypothetical protein
LCVFVRRFRPSHPRIQAAKQQQQQQRHRLLNLPAACSPIRTSCQQQNNNSINASSSSMTLLASVPGHTATSGGTRSRLIIEQAAVTDAAEFPPGPAISGTARAYQQQQ